MVFSKTIQREIEVAFSRHAQPIWFRVVKYIVLISMVYFLWNTKLFWIILLILTTIALFLHFWYRYKTKGWTETYGMWNYDRNRPKDQ